MVLGATLIFLVTNLKLTLSGTLSFFYMNLLSAFLLDKIGLICEQIPPEEFEELTECAYEGLENKIPLVIISISIKEEYKMRIPRRFSAWMTNTEKMTRHCPEYGFYNMPREGLFIPMMWVNRMKKGDQHQVHQHNKDPSHVVIMMLHSFLCIQITLNIFKSMNIVKYISIFTAA